MGKYGLYYLLITLIILHAISISPLNTIRNQDIAFIITKIFY